MFLCCCQFLLTIGLLKNVCTRQCVTTLRHITALNNDIVHIPPALSALVISFRGKTSFSHIQRLHNMLYAYGATIIEIVRRKEFCEYMTLLSDYPLFIRNPFQHASSIIALKVF